MAVSESLLAMLVCPLTKVKLQLADSELLERLNAQISQHTLKNRAGSPVAEALEAALVTVDGRLAYPVRDDIPVMLIDEAIELLA